MCYFIAPFIFGLLGLWLAIKYLKRYREMAVKYEPYRDSWKWLEMTGRNKAGAYIMFIFAGSMFLCSVASFVNWIWG